MNSKLRTQVETEADRLHFEVANRLLRECKETDDCQWNRLMARIQRGLFRQAEALEHAELGGSDPAGQLELAKCLFSAGRIQDAGRILETLMADAPDLKTCLAYAAYCGEIGQVRRARSILQSMDPESLPEGPDRMDWLILSADLASFEEKTEEAFTWYRRALDEVQRCIPANWQPLRRMLILHNMADTYEQLEQMLEAEEAYGAAMLEMRHQKLTDPQVTDLSGYFLELLLSVANCHGNMEEFEAAAEYLQQADSLFSQLPPRQKEYFAARRNYIGGLIALNEGKEDQARDLLDKALQLQTELCRNGKDKPEHLARTAYYLASVIPDDEWQQKLDLYSLAFPVFQSVQEKEPSFYLTSMADIENERGRLSLDPETARSHYEAAIRFYDQILSSHPDDRLARESRLAATVNLYTMEPDPDLEKRLKKELELLAAHDPNPLFLNTIVEYLADRRSEPEFHDWMTDFSRRLPDPYDA